MDPRLVTAAMSFMTKSAMPMTPWAQAGHTVLREGLSVLGNIARDRHAAMLAAKNAPAVMNPIHGLLMNAGALAAGTGAIMAVGAVADSYQVGQSYNKMLTLYPELSREDPQRVKNIFDAIASGSPDLAKQPMIVGSLVRRMLNYDGFDHTTFNDLVSAQSAINKGRQGATQTLLGVGTSGLSLLHNYGINAPPRR